jgi:prephenate dehydrogenase
MTLSSTSDWQGINKLVVIGIGLIGGSLATGLKARGACKEVIGIARRQEICEEAVALGVVDRAYVELADVASELGEGDVIFIAVPTLSVGRVLQTVKSTVPSSVTVTDGASVKGSVQQAAETVYGQVPPQLVLGHPIAGSEKSGVTAANPDLYEKHRVILTPLETTGAQHLDVVTRMWQAVGAEVLSMTVAEHDDVLAATSHLPHAIAYSLVDTLAQDIGNPNIFRYAAGGFRDFTRIASSDPVMWHDIMRANKTSVLHALDLYIDNLMRLRTGIEQENSEYLLDVFTRAKTARDRFTRMLANKGEPDRESRQQVDDVSAPGAEATGDTP